LMVGWLGGRADDITEGKAQQSDSEEYQHAA